MAYATAHGGKRTRPHSLEDEEGDNVSHSSCNASSPRNSDSDDGGGGGNGSGGATKPLCVREMVRRYNTATAVASGLHSNRIQRQTSHHSLATATSVCGGLNYIGSQTNVRQHVQRYQQQQQQQHEPSESEPTPRSDSGRCIACQRKVNARPHFEREQPPAPPSTPTSSARSDAGQQLVKTSVPPALPCRRNRNRSASSVEEACLQPLESSYQSKTTIAKTSSGVRIIIDIYFDQDQQQAMGGNVITSPADVLGSRVETDIPQSRILNEFQQQALSHVAPIATNST